LSGGERQLLAFGMALVHNPKIVLFDEPFAGLDKDNAVKMFETILKQNNSEITFLVAEHKMILFQNSNQVIKLELGKIVN
jgi:energy-coupling factor transporter ATP-binding protein EcfA2